MKIWVAMIALLATLGPVAAQTNAPDIDLGDVLDGAQQWAQDNLDPDVLNALPSVDRNKIEDFLNHYQDYLQGDSVLDVAQLKSSAKTILPLLEAHEETQPYADWLKARLDYFEVAADLQTNAQPPAPGTNAAPALANPTFASEEEIWINKVAPLPWPEAAKKYVPELKAIFDTEQVPAALVWLAEVESGFNRQARSPTGAVGLFQLMPDTAKSLGLSLWPFDQRKQTEPAARAAAKYLRYLQSKFGDWQLAVAAYNCGEGRLSRTLKKYDAKRFADIAQHLPAETQMYVPKVDAILKTREGTTLQKLKTP